jgi:hypothetical protein
LCSKLASIGVQSKSGIVCPIAYWAAKQSRVRNCPSACDSSSEAAMRRQVFDGGPWKSLPKLLTSTQQGQSQTQNSPAQSVPRAGSMPPTSARLQRHTRVWALEKGEERSVWGTRGDREDTRRVWLLKLCKLVAHGPPRTAAHFPIQMRPLPDAEVPSDKLLTSMVARQGVPLKCSSKIEFTTSLPLTEASEWNYRRSCNDR